MKGEGRKENNLITLKEDNRIICGCMVNNIGLLPFTENTKSKISKMCGIAGKINGVRRIVLFGSYARNEYTANSDLDFLLLTEEQLNHEESGYLKSVFEENDCDVVIYTEEKFAHSHVALAEEIRKDGVLLWER